MPVYGRKLKRGYRFFFSGQYLGVKYFSKCIYKTKTEAGRAERKKRDEIDEQARNPYNDMPLKSLVDARLQEIGAKKSKKYHKENKRYFDFMLEHLGSVKVSEIGKSDINDLLTRYSKELAAKKKTNHKVNAMLRSYKALFNFGIRIFELSIRNPCTGLTFYPIDRKLKHIPSDKEIEAVKEKCNPGERLLIEFVETTGARIGEALRVTGEDTRDGYVVLYTRKSKSSNLIGRKVPLSLDLPRKRGRIFGRWTDQPRFLEKKVKDLKQTPWSWHNLRHRYASRLSKEGRPLFEIMSLLGHSNLSTTQIYLQMLP